MRRDKPLIVIGLDGLGWGTIDQLAAEDPDLIPFLEHIRQGGGWSTSHLFVSDVPHTAPSWTTIFSGATVEEHGNRDWKVRDLTTGEKLGDRTRADIPVRFIWETLHLNSYYAAAFSMPFVLPPYTFMSGFDQDLRFDLTLTLEEMEQAMRNQLDELVRLLARGVDFVAFVNIVLDKAHHISSKAGLGNVEGAKDAYRRVDEWLRYIVALRKGFASPPDFVLVSDHSLPAKAWEYPEGWTIPGHHRDAIFATTVKGLQLPRETSEVATFLAACFGVEHDPRTVRDLQTTGPDLTPDEEQLLQERLAALGYE